MTTHQNPQGAFGKAIEQGRLSTDPKSTNYAGSYMYMYTDESGKDMFKNINSRKYDV